MARKINSRNEFRYKKMDKASRHPVYIYAKIGNKLKYVGITHSNITDGIENIPLIKNPNPKDKRKSYMRPYSRLDHKTSFGKKQKGWKLHPEDKKKIPK